MTTRNPTARELRAQLFEIGNQDAPLSDEVLRDLVRPVLAPMHPALARLAYHLQDRLEHAAARGGLEVVGLLVTYADGLYQVEDGPTFEDARECADALVEFQAEHSDDMG